MPRAKAQLIEKVCEGCGGTFAMLPSRTYRVCCSVACIAVRKAKQAERITKPCATCGTPFTRLVSQVTKEGVGQYCSRDCIPKPEQIPRTCEHCGGFFTVKLSRLLIGKYKGQYCSLRCQRDSQKKPWGPSKARPGIDTWRRAVLTRDNHTCQHCGATDRPLNAHHVKPWAEYPELRTVTSNGLALCDVCHFALHYPDLANPYAA